MSDSSSEANRNPYFALDSQYHLEKLVFSTSYFHIFINFKDQLEEKILKYNKQAMRKKL